MLLQLDDARFRDRAGDVSRDDRDALLADAANLRRPAGERDVGDRDQRHRGARCRD
jgi:hypothetical protein